MLGCVEQPVTGKHPQRIRELGNRNVADALGLVLDERYVCGILERGLSVEQNVRDVVPECTRGCLSKGRMSMSVDDYWPCVSCAMIYKEGGTFREQS